MDPYEFPHEFLTWFGDAIARTWERDRERYGHSVRPPSGSTEPLWQPLTEEEIARAEARWGLRFPPDLREFQRVLGHTDRATQEARRGSVDWWPVQFHDWRDARGSVADALRAPLEGVLFDVEQGLWYPSWGPRPESLEERRVHVRRLVEAAPPLIPVLGHRYLAGDPDRSRNLVLSVVQTDVIPYGPNLYDYLVHELRGYLGLDGDPSPWVHQREWDESLNARLASIPFWGPLVLDQQRLVAPEDPA